MQERTIEGHTLTCQQPAYDCRRFFNRRYRVELLDADPLQELFSARAQAEVEPPAGKLIQCSGHHRQFCWINCIRIDDARPDFDSLSSASDGGENDRGAAQK